MAPGVDYNLFQWNFRGGRAIEDPTTKFNFVGSCPPGPSWGRRLWFLHLYQKLTKSRHGASTSTSWHFAFGTSTLFCCSIIATKPVHRLQIRPIVHNQSAPRTISPNLHPGPCSSVRMRRGTDRQTDTQTAVTNIHFASAAPHATCKYALCDVQRTLTWRSTVRARRTSSRKKRKTASWRTSTCPSPPESTTSTFASRTNTSTARPSPPRFQVNLNTPGLGLAWAPGPRHCTIVGPPSHTCVTLALDTYVSFSGIVDGLVLTMHKTLLIEQLTYVQNILQPSFVGTFDVVGPRHLPTMPFS